MGAKTSYASPTALTVVLLATVPAAPTPLYGQAWHLAAEPTLEIGVVEGDPRYELFRVAGIVELNDGRIAVANGGSSEIRFYDSHGVFVRSTGGVGEGPQEFQYIAWLTHLGDDTLAVYDWQNERVTLLDDRGAFLRAYSLQSFARAGVDPTVVGPLTNRSLLIKLRPALQADTVRTGWRRDTLWYVRYDLETARTDTLGRFPDSEYFTRAWGNGMISQLPRAFGRYARVTVHRNGFYYGSSDRYEITYYDSDGVRITTVRGEERERRVTQQDIERYERTLVQDWAELGLRQMAERLLLDMEYPDEVPAHGDLRVDDQGNLWVAEYVRLPFRHTAEKAAPLRWEVFSPNGSSVAVVDTPPGFTPFHIGTDFVLGVWKDEADVEYVRRYELRKR